MRQFCFCGQKLPYGGSSCGNSGRPLELPLDTLHWRGPVLVPVSHLGEDQLLEALGGLHYRTNELIGEDGNVVIRLAPVWLDGIDYCVAGLGIFGCTTLDDSVVNTRCLGFLLLCSAVCLLVPCDSAILLACERSCCQLPVVCYSM